MLWIFVMFAVFLATTKFGLIGGLVCGAASAIVGASIWERVSLRRNRTTAFLEMINDGSLPDEVRAAISNSLDPADWTPEVRAVVFARVREASKVLRVVSWVHILACGLTASLGAAGGVVLADWVVGWPSFAQGCVAGVAFGIPGAFVGSGPDCLQGGVFGAFLACEKSPSFWGTFAGLAVGGAIGWGIGTVLGFFLSSRGLVETM